MSENKIIIFGTGEFAQEILDLTNSKSKVIHENLPEDDPKKRRPDISKAKKLLDWEPKVSRREGLIRTLESIKICEK